MLLILHFVSSHSITCLTANIHYTLHFMFAAIHVKKFDTHTHLSSLRQVLAWNCNFTQNSFTLLKGRKRRERKHLDSDLLLLFIQHKQYSQPGQLDILLARPYQHSCLYISNTAMVNWSFNETSAQLCQSQSPSIL